MDINPDADDLPLRANTNHILVRHYVLDLTVHFERKVISGSVVLFLEPCSGMTTDTEGDVGSGVGEEDGTAEGGESQDWFVYKCLDTLEDSTKGPKETNMICGSGEVDRDKSGVRSQTSAETKNIQSSHLWETTSDEDFTLVLDCCDLDVSKVEELDFTSVSAMSSLLPEVTTESSGPSSVDQQAAFIRNLISIPSSRWRQKHQLFLLCSCAPGSQNGSELPFQRDQWSLQVRKRGIASPHHFPPAVRIRYETRPTGRSMRWTKDQDNRYVSRCKRPLPFLKLASHVLRLQRHILRSLCRIIPIH